MDNEEKKHRKRKRDKEGTDGGRKPNWREYSATVEDIQQFLDAHIRLRRNEVTRKVEYRVPKADAYDKVPGLEPTQEWQPIDEVVLNTLWTALSAQKVTRAQDVYRVIESNHVPPFNPFTFYLDCLPPWDGQNHIMELAMSVTVKGDVEEQARFYEYLRKWLVGMVAGWVDPREVNNVILVLIGEQGSYKTTWFNYLLPPELRSYFYTKTNANRLSRDDLLMLAEKGLVCCEELDTMRPSELNQLKAAVTMPYIDVRAPYDHYPSHRKHIASFCGTGNNRQFLTDATGNRRWLPFEVESIDSPRASPLDYRNIYAEAFALYKQSLRGEYSYWFSRDEIAELSRHNRQFETPHMETELVQQYFRLPGRGEPGEFMPVSLALQIVGQGITQKLSTVMLGRAFVELGFEPRVVRHVRGYVVVRLSAEEMRSMRHLMARESEEQVTDGTDIF